MRKAGGGWESGVGLKPRLDLNKKEKCGGWLPYHHDPPSALRVMMVVVLMMTIVMEIIIEIIKPSIVLRNRRPRPRTVPTP